MGKGDSVPDVRDGRPDFQLETERAGVPEDTVVGRRISSLTVSETKEERVTTKNMSTDLDDPSGRTQRVRSWDDQAFAIGYVDSVIGAPENKDDLRHRGRIPNQCSRHTELGTHDSPCGTTNEDVGCRFMETDTGPSMSCATRGETSTWICVPPLEETRHTKQKLKSTKVGSVSRGATRAR